MYKNILIEINLLFANFLGSIISYFMLYKSFAPEGQGSLESLGQTLLIIGAPFYIFAMAALLWGFQYYLAYCYRRSDYRFLYLLLPLLVTLNAFRDNGSPDAPLYSLAFNLLVFVLFFSLPLAMFYLHFRPRPQSSEVEKAKHGV